MRPGGGKQKGSSFERKAGQLLSLWITSLRRNDLFARNVLSGGRFTVRRKTDQTTSMPGDLMAADDEAFVFTRKFAVECKHTKDLELGRLMLDHERKSFLSRVYTQMARDAEHAKLWPMVIAKQNNAEAICMMPASILVAITANLRRGQKFRYHLLHEEEILVCRLKEFTSKVSPKVLEAIALPS